jgi:hypothetical protein|tara:strand:- start:1076 stop:1294 length:219 start_codon:yes stop_codon:yes gene_type:complete
MTQRLKGKIRQADTIVAQTVKIGSGLSLGDLSDVSIQGQTDGVMMIFNGTTGQYEVSTQINNENLNIIGGTY